MQSELSLYCRVLPAQIHVALGVAHHDMVYSQKPAPHTDVYEEVPILVDTVHRTYPVFNHVI